MRLTLQLPRLILVEGSLAALPDEIDRLGLNRPLASGQRIRTNTRVRGTKDFGAIAAADMDAQAIGPGMKQQTGALAIACRDPVDEGAARSQRESIPMRGRLHDVVPMLHREAMFDAPA